MAYLSHQIDNFTGGITDQAYSGNKAQMEACDNLLLTPDGKLKQRPGSTIFNTFAYQVPTASRIGALINFNFDQRLVAQSGRSLFEATEDGSFNINGLVQIYGPNGSNKALPDGLLGAMDANTRISSAQWNRHLLVTHEFMPNPVKVYLSNNGSGFPYLQVRTAGLPPIPAPSVTTDAATLAAAIALVNDLRTKILAHLNTVSGTGNPTGTQTHSRLDNVSIAMITAPSASDLPSAISLCKQLLQSYNNHQTDSVQLAPTFHFAVTVTATTAGGGSTVYTVQPPNGTLLDSTAPQDLNTLVTRLNNLLACYNSHTASVTHSTYSLFSLGASPYDPIPGSWVPSYSSVTPNTSGITIPQSLTEAIALANDLYSKWSAHCHDVPTTGNNMHGSASQFTTTVTPTDFETLKVRTFFLLLDYSIHNADAIASTPYYHYHHSIQSNSVAGGYTLSNLAGIATALSQLRNAFNSHDGDPSCHTNLTNALHNSTSPSVSGGSYNYAFCYHYKYQIDALIFEDFGPVSYIGGGDLLSPSDASAVHIQNIPAFASSTQLNYDISKLTLRIYRTQSNGTVYRQVAEIPVSSTSYVDTYPDNFWSSGAALYTTGGVLSNDPPPPCKYVHVCNNKAYYGYIQDTDGVSILPNRVRVSVDSDIDSCPGSLYDDLEEDVCGISSSDDRVIVFGKTSTYRLEGSFDLRGGGYLNHIKISNQTGCIDATSIQQVQGGVVFAGNGGFFFTDGLSVRKISNHLNTTFNNVASQGKFKPCYERTNNRVWWGVQLNAGSADSDSCLVLDLRWGISDQCTFTTTSGSPPTALTFFQNQVVAGDPYGNIIKYSNSVTTDIKDIGSQQYAGKPVIYRFKSLAEDFGSSLVRKWVPSLTVTAENLGNLSLQINSYNDKKTTSKAITPIRSRPSNGTGVIEHRRRMPAGGLRCSYKQIELTNAYVDLTNSDTLGLCNFSGTTTKTAVLTTGGAQWVLDLTDCFISAETPTPGVYTQDYALVSGGGLSNTITFSDPGNTCPTGVRKWVVKGIPKGEVFSLVNYNINHVFLSPTQAPFQSSESGKNS